MRVCGCGCGGYGCGGCDEVSKQNVVYKEPMPVHTFARLDRLTVHSERCSKNSFNMPHAGNKEIILQSLCQRERTRYWSS